MSCIPDSKAQDSGFHEMNFPDSGLHEQNFSGLRNPLHEAIMRRYNYKETRITRDTDIDNVEPKLGVFT